MNGKKARLLRRMSRTLKLMPETTYETYVVRSMKNGTSHQTRLNKKCQRAYYKFLKWRLG